jgi:hypothetical protein
MSIISKLKGISDNPFIESIRTGVQKATSFNPVVDPIQKVRSLGLQPDYSTPQGMQDLAMSFGPIAIGSIGKNAGNALKNRMNKGVPGLEDLRSFSDFTDYVAGTSAFSKATDAEKFKYEGEVRELAAVYGLNPNVSNLKLAHKLGRFLDKHRYWERIKLNK